MFDKNDEIKAFSELTDKLCPFGYKLDLDEEIATFYKTEYHATYNIPQITETITVHKFFHVKLFFNSSLVPLPELFRKGSDCRLKRKSMLENFPNYIRNFQETKNIPSDILNELQEIRFKNPVDRSKYSVHLLRYALLLRYTSTQACKLLLEQFPLPSLSLLKKLNKGGMGPIKAVKVLLDQGKIGENVVLLLDEIYLQKGIQYQGGKLVGVDSEGNLFKGVMTFIITV